MSIFLTISLIVGTVAVAAVGTASPTPVVSVRPQTVTAEVGEAFTVDITVADITSEESLYGWEFRMSFNPNILHAGVRKTDTWTGDGNRTVFNTARRPILPDSEKVYVNETPMTKPANYTIHYTAGNITLKTAPGLGAETKAVYLYDGVMEGSFLKIAGDTSWGIMPPKIDNYGGWVNASDGLWTYPAIGAVGTGTLANITFQVKAEGKTTLRFNKTELFTYNGTWIVPIDHTVVNGVFAYPLLRDIAVTGVTASPPSVPAGEPVYINATVKNEGEVAETFDITVLYDSTNIETKTVTDLVPGGSETLSFSWDTKDVDEGNYTITVLASEIGGETDTADNTYTNVVVTVTAPLPAFPMQLFFAIIVAVATMCCVVVVFYLRRRRPTKQ